MSKIIHTPENNADKTNGSDESIARIRELSRSVTTLLDNMPALTFYKDKDTGKYLACNQAFALSAGKKHPREVIGLTDHDIYDPVTADHFVEYDKKALAMDKPFVYFEDVLDAKGNHRRFQTTKLKFTDPLGKERLLGMCVDVTETEKAKEAYEAAIKESLTYARIARALSTDYVYLYYVDLDTDEFIEYRSDSSEENLRFERRDNDFFRRARTDAIKVIDKADQEVFLAAFTKTNIISKIDSIGTFTLTYRMRSNGSSVCYNMKASRIKGDDSHIIIGVNNVEAQMKDQEALVRAREERITYSRITALSGDFICIYTVDPETDDFVEYGATSEYEALGLQKSGKDFFGVSKKEGKRSVYPEDLGRFEAFMNKETVFNEIKENGIFAFNYRLMIHGEPVYVMLKATIVEEQDGPQLIVGVINVDAQVKREQNYLKDLSIAREKADMDALTGVKNKHAYIDLEAAINQRIDENNPVEFAIAIFDVNGLKYVNDHNGHAAGDEHIKSACKVICDIFKHSPVFRVGGDEFVAIIQGSDYARLDELVNELDKVNRENAKSGKVVTACGTARYVQGDRNVAAVFERADKLMYENKRGLKG